MDTANLSAFLAVAASGSFSRAAEALHLTQPAISKRIAALESQLSARLFDRIGRSITLTEAGRVLQPRAEQIIGVLGDTERALSNLSSTVQGRLSLATSHHIGLHRLPPVLRQYTKSYPGVALDIRFLDSEIAHDRVMHGEVELAVITLAPAVELPVIAEQIWDDVLEFVVAPEHPLAAEQVVTLEQLASYPAVFPGLDTFTHRIVSQLFERHSITPQVSMSTNYLETIKMMVAIGLAWSVLPRTMLDEQVRSLTVPDARLVRQLGCIWHSGRTMSNAGRAMIDMLKEHPA
ncbi:LysR family transcriptional regulator [Pseudomonas saliphila]|uniref:LysR family transcriptional regulator n=1 Tax=Pseudomonas saliphila TaxID=2586906 RepID=UPI00123ADFD4|nr:LysR family transcriptional regulator [Pseudomonas saliphila]